MELALQKRKKSAEIKIKVSDRGSTDENDEYEYPINININININMKSYTESKNKNSFLLFNIINIHYLHIICCYLYLKSFEQCDPKNFDCDLYYDKFTLLYKIFLIMFSGGLNGFLIVFIVTHIYRKGLLILETFLLSFPYLLINYSSGFYADRNDSFEHSGVLFLICMLGSIIVVSVSYFFILRIPVWARKALAVGRD